MFEYNLVYHSYFERVAGELVGSEAGTADRGLKMEIVQNQDLYLVLKLQYHK